MSMDELLGDDGPDTFRLTTAGEEWKRRALMAERKRSWPTARAASTGCVGTGKARRWAPDDQCWRSDMGTFYRNASMREVDDGGCTADEALRAEVRRG